MWKKLKETDYRLWLCFALVIGSILLGVAVYEYPFIRFGESMGDFGRVMAYAFTDLMELSEGPPMEQTVNNFSSVDLRELIDVDFSGISDKLSGVWSQIFVRENWQYYSMFLLWWFVRYLLYVCMALIVLMILFMPIILTWEDVNNDYNRDTVPLKIFKRVVALPCRRIFAWCRDFWQFFRESACWRWFLLVWAFNLGLFTVIFGFLAYYFYVLISFDISTIGIQVVKLLADVLLMLHTMPFICWAIIAAVFISAFFRKIALARLRGQVNQNMAMQEKLPMVTFLVGLPRSGKTTMLTAMALFYSVLFRNKALELMEGNDLKFPRFPWINLELELRACVEHHTVWNLATVRRWIRLKRAGFEKNPCKEKIFGYDYKREPCTYDDHLQIISVWDALENYAQEFFIYWMQTSLLIGNFAVREDFIFMDEGNFPIVDTDFFTREARDIAYVSSMSHILDYDMLRLGKKMNEDNVNTGALEFGIVLISEVDKERKNNTFLQELKAKSKFCNQKNDLVEENIQIAGHGATVENFCFFRLIIDAQRPEGWSAKGRELTTVIHISPKSGTYSALPFFWIVDGIVSRYLDWWRSVRRNSRYKWGNNRLIIWFFHGLASLLYTYRLRRVNDYGFYKQTIGMESGKLDGSVEEMKMCMPFKVVYSRRFATDCFKAISATQAEKCTVGLNDLATYEDIYPSFDELQAQNSHFIKELFQYYEIVVEDDGEE